MNKIKRIKLKRIAHWKSWEYSKKSNGEKSWLDETK